MSKTKVKELYIIVQPDVSYSKRNPLDLRTKMNFHCLFVNLFIHRPVFWLVHECVNVCLYILVLIYKYAIFEEAGLLTMIFPLLLDLFFLCCFSTNSSLLSLKLQTYWNRLGFCQWIERSQDLTHDINSLQIFTNSKLFIFLKFPPIFIAQPALQFAFSNSLLFCRKRLSLSYTVMFYCPCFKPQNIQKAKKKSIFY